MVGGKAHDLLSKTIQDEYITRIESGEYDICIYSPPCATWSRAQWANTEAPLPCRDKDHPWGFPGALAPQRNRADTGNEFIHFT